MGTLGNINCRFGKLLETLGNLNCWVCKLLGIFGNLNGCFGELLGIFGNFSELSKKGSCNNISFDILVVGSTLTNAKTFYIKLLYNSSLLLK